MQTNDQITSTYAIATRVGWWSALGVIVTFSIFTLCFVLIALLVPRFTWTTLSAYVKFTQTTNTIFADLARLMMLLFAVCYLLLLNSIHEVIPEGKRYFTRMSLCFGSVFACLISVHYFIQLTTVRLALAQGSWQGLEQFVQANPFSAIAAMNVLGWSLFLGVSTLLLAPIFSGRGLERVLAVACIVNGVMCLLGGFGFALQITWLVFLTLNFGMGGAILLLSVALCLWFRRRSAVQIQERQISGIA